ncbi:intermembrane lipid transfer protein vps13B-like [Oppia nitens]|uniref:intermembrane lipid transfer protein vps13B-like n=1 Tax=Oppia nitens TaxID=1686743 RepID=UPI0023D9999B|nr:intermembrane lipid transfer protein vps13B-like [Oppia nitens]
MNSSTTTEPQPAIDDLLLAEDLDGQQLSAREPLINTDSDDGDDRRRLSDIVDELEAKETQILKLTLILDKFFTMSDEFRQTLQEFHRNCKCNETERQRNRYKTLDEDYESIVREYHQNKYEIDDNDNEVMIVDDDDSDYEDDTTVDKQSSDITPTDESFLCPKCGNSLSKRCHLLSHVHRMHYMKTLNELEKSIQDKTEYFKCQYSDCQFINRYPWITVRHIFDQHLGFNKYLKCMPFSCELCGKDYMKVRYAMIHMKDIHNTSVEYFKCTASRCDYVTNELRLITEHRKVTGHMLSPICFSSKREMYLRDIKSLNYGSTVQTTTNQCIDLTDEPTDNVLTTDCHQMLSESSDTSLVDKFDERMDQIIAQQIRQHSLHNRQQKHNQQQQQQQLLSSSDEDTRPDDKFIFGSLLVNLMQSNKPTGSVQTATPTVGTHIIGDYELVINKRIMNKKTVPYFRQNRNADKIYKYKYCYKCDRPNCNYYTTSKNTFLNHTRKMHALKCDKCETCFVSADTLVDHLMANDCNNTVLFCSVCFKEFSDLNTYEMHKQQHNSSSGLNRAEDLVSKNNVSDNDKTQEPDLQIPDHQLDAKESNDEIHEIIPTTSTEKCLKRKSNLKINDLRYDLDNSDNQPISVNINDDKDDENDFMDDNLSNNESDNNFIYGKDLLSKIQIKSECDSQSTIDFDDNIDNNYNTNLPKLHTKSKIGPKPKGQLRLQRIVCPFCKFSNFDNKSIVIHKRLCYQQSLDKKFSLIDNNVEQQTIGNCGQNFVCDVPDCGYECTDLLIFNDHKQQHLTENIDKIINEFQDGIHRTIEIKREIIDSDKDFNVNDFLELADDVMADKNCTENSDNELSLSLKTNISDNQLSDDSNLSKSATNCLVNKSLTKTRLRGLNSPREPIRMASESSKKISELFKRHKK